MPKVEDDNPTGLKVFRFYGVELGWSGSGQGIGPCPFCGKEQKFYVHPDTGQWDCKSCSMNGNPLTFIRSLWEASDARTKDYSDLAENRGLLFPESLIPWEVARSVLRPNEWLVPEYDIHGKLCCLSKYSPGPRGKHILFASPQVAGISHGMFGMNLFKREAKDIFVCEGPWDGIAWWEVLRIAKQDDDGKIVMTGTELSSLLADASVLAMPGNGTFKEAWLPLFAGKRVFLLYDSDHPKLSCPTCRKKWSKITNKQCPTCRVDLVLPESPPAGLAGMQRAASMLMRCSTPPEDVQYIHWGDEGFAIKEKDGFDVRDYLSQGKTPEHRVELLAPFIERLKSVPEAWDAGRAAKARKRGESGNDVEMIHCGSWEVLIAAWKDAMAWHTGLDYTLSTMLASVASTRSACDQLWIQVVSPPSTGKTELVTGLLTNRRWTKETGTFTGLHSGFQTDNEGKEDHSTIALIKDKTFIVKDGDTILKATNREKLLSQIRDAYDTYCSVSYGNKVKRDYKDHRFTFILCGTESMLELDAAELGARFLNCVILEEIDPDMESRVNKKRFRQIWANRGAEANGIPGSADDAKKLYARQLTAGYVEFLRENSANMRARLEVDESVVESTLDRFATFIAMMRARPAKKQSEVEAREMSSRVLGQLASLAINTAVVLGKRTIDAEVMLRVVKVTRDTARGKTLDIANLLYRCKDEGAEPASLSVWMSKPEEEILTLLRFLASKKIGVAERFKPAKGSPSSRPRYRLTERFKKLYVEVIRAESRSKHPNPSAIGGGLASKIGSLPT